MELYHHKVKGLVLGTNLDRGCVVGKNNIMLDSYEVQVE
jgi:hypothetical protein